MRIRKILTFFGVLSGLVLLPGLAMSNPITPVLKVLAGIIHAHCNFGDGKWSIKFWADTGRKRGLDFIILTPHATEIDNPIKVLDARIHYKGPVGYANFVKQCAENSTGGIQIIPGVEFGDAKDGNSHFLVLGLYDSKVFNEALKIYKKSGQKATLKYFNDLGVTTRTRPGHIYSIIAAHPDFDYRHMDPSSKVVSDTKYRFNFRETDSKGAAPTGLELLNNGNVSTDTLETNLAHLYSSNLGAPFTSITGGCDFHSPEAETAAVVNEHMVFHKKPYPEALNRQTVVWSLSNKQRDILSAILAGSCGALYRRSSAFNVKKLPQGFVESEDRQYNQQNTPKTYHLKRYFPVGMKHFVYCWYKIKQDMSKTGSGSTNKAIFSLVRLPKKKYFPGQDEVLLEDNMVDLVQQYILVIDSPDYFLVTSPQIFTNESMSSTSFF